MALLSAVSDIGCWADASTSRARTERATDGTRSRYVERLSLRGMRAQHTLLAMGILSVVIDCADPDRLAPFWAEALGYQNVWSNGEFVVLASGKDGVPNLLLQRVPEAKVAKNRVHLDLLAPDLEAEIQRMVGLGATRGADFAIEGIVRWNIMTDPDGNEFCLSCPSST
jgi:hypothetical protein